MTFLSKAKSYGHSDFSAMVESLHYPLWKPKYIVLHNTGVPSLAQFKAGRLSEQQHVDNIVTYWRGKGWHSGAHLIVSPKFIWVACALTEDGVHCSCANNASIGVEMVGDYSREDFNSGEGAAVRDNAVFALATLHKKLGLTPSPRVAWKKGLHFHKQCTADHHDCPGKGVSMADMVARVTAQMGSREAVVSLAFENATERAPSSDVRNAYPELPVLDYARTKILMGDFVKYLGGLEATQHLKRSAYVIFRNESGAGQKGINNNYIGLQADGGRQADEWTPSFNGTCLKAENMTGKLRRFICFKNWQGCVDLLVDKIKSRGLYVGGHAHPYANMDIKTADDWPSAYYQEWVRGEHGAKIPGDAKANLLKQYRYASGLFPDE